MTGDLRLVADLYDAYNTRDADTLVDLLAEDVDYPDKERRLHGPAAVRRYWTQQWTRTRTHDEPVKVMLRGEGGVEVHVDQVVRDLSGSVLSTGTYVHTWRFVDGRAARLDIRTGISR